MPSILTIGSLNIDQVYHVPHFVQPGETLSATNYTRGPGGKGLNQSIAAARAGASVRHIGRIGMDGRFLGDLLFNEQVDIADLQVGECATGHAIIQVDAQGENCILLFPGANAALDLDEVQKVIEQASDDDILLMQNEINGMSRILEMGYQRGLRMVLNTAPITPIFDTLPIEYATVLICNETEGQALTGLTDPQALLEALQLRCPNTTIILTLGADGCRCLGPSDDWHVPATKVEPVDTTAAGDTFAGYFTAAMAAGENYQSAAEYATAAAAITVTRPGAANSIPRANELS